MSTPRFAQNAVSPFRVPFRHKFEQRGASEPQRPRRRSTSWSGCGPTWRCWSAAMRSDGRPWSSSSTGTSLRQGAAAALLCTAGGNSGKCSAMSHTFASHVLPATPWHDRIPGTPTGQPTQPTCSHIPCAFTLTCAHCHHGAGVCASPATRRTPELKLHCVR